MPRRPAAWFPSHSCALKPLPEDQWEAAATTAIDINPANAVNRSMFGLITMPKPQSIAGLTGKSWGPQGVNLGVKFLEQTISTTKNKILAYMNKWGANGAQANIKFFESASNSDIRLTLASGGYACYLGTDLRHIPITQPSMWLQGFTATTSDAEYDRVVTHEAGHACGFMHEHTRLDIVKRLDVEAVVKWGRDTQGWGRQTVYDQILTPTNESALWPGSTPVDENSVMCYWFAANLTKNHVAIIGGKGIDESDAAFARQSYPPPGGPVVPPQPPVVVAGDIAIDLGRKVVTYPAGWTARQA